MNLLEIRDLSLNINHHGHSYHILRGVNLNSRRGGALGIVGESGSGKTMTCLAVMRLLPKASQILRGEIVFNGTDLCKLSEKQMEAVRGRDICMIFQDARSALNPVLTIGSQISDIYCKRTGKSNKEGVRSAIRLLDSMGMPNPRSQARSYPHELSGGMCQRALIAMAVASSPRLLIADEITSGLDVTIQTQVLGLIRNVVAEIDASLILVSHDINVIIETCSEIGVMYSGVVMECGDIDTVIGEPRNPYTKALLDCSEIRGRDRMAFIPGTAPDLRTPHPGCPFASRCPDVMDICRTELPKTRRLAPGQWVTCHKFESEED